MNITKGGSNEYSGRRKGRLASAPRKALGPFGGPPQSEKVVTATLYNTQLNFARGTVAFARLPDVVAVDPQTFKTMTPPRTAAGTGTNTIQQLGVEQATASVGATQLDPYQRNFWGIKIDHPGWNATSVVQWDANVSQFAYVKTSPVVLEITLPDAPIVTSEAVKMIRPGVMTNAQLTAAETARFGNGAGAPIWDEIRPIGAWQYMIVPAQKAASISLRNTVGLDKWQQLMQLGYKPKTCKGNKYRVAAGVRGFDQAGQSDCASHLLALIPAGAIPARNSSTDGFGPGQYTKTHSTQETDWCVQFFGAGSFADTYAGAIERVENFRGQGYDVVAFGSCIIFQFCQYAPPTVEGLETAAIQRVPVTLTIHNKTVFTQLKTASRDLGQVFTTPITLPS